MADKFLNKTGLSRFWTIIKSALAKKQSTQTLYYAGVATTTVYVTTTMKADANRWFEFYIEGIAGHSENPGLDLRVHAWYETGEGFVQNNLHSWGNHGGLDNIKIHLDEEDNVYLSFTCRKLPMRFRVSGYYSNSTGAENMVTSVVKTAPATFVTTVDIVQTPTQEEQREQLLDFLAYHELYFYPVILEQPQDITAEAGTTAYFPIRAGGDGLTYTWYYRNPNTTGDEFRKSTATTDTYSIKTSATSHNQGFFVYCVVTDVRGNSVQTRTAAMTLS